MMNQPTFRDPASYDEAAQRVHRAFCRPDEAVGEWDARMAQAIRERGYALISYADLEQAMAGYHVHEADVHEPCPSCTTFLKKVYRDLQAS